MNKFEIEKRTPFLKEECISVSEVARLLRITPRTVTKYRLEGKIPSIRLSPRKHLFLKRDLENLLSLSYGRNDYFRE